MLEPKWQQCEHIDHHTKYKHQQQYHSSSSLLAAVLLCGGSLYHAPTLPPIGHDGKVVTITGASTDVLPLQLAQKGGSNVEPVVGDVQAQFEIPPATATLPALP